MMGKSEEKRERSQYVEKIMSLDASLWRGDQWRAR